MIHWIVTMFVLAAGCAVQHDPAPGAQRQAEGLSRDAGIDQILDALDERGQNLQSLAADVTLIETDETTGTDVARSGRFVIVFSPDGSARSLIRFNDRIANNRKTEERIEYLLDGQNLIDRTYRTKTQVTRQVLRPGEKINLLKLGEGPFPLPIGQDKEEVHRLFEVKKIETKKDDPANTLHVQLIPKPGTQFDRKFMSIDAWIDLADHMPKRIETVDPNGVTIRTTDLSNVRINAEIAPAELQLEKIDEKDWNLIYERFDDGSSQSTPDVRGQKQ